MSTPVTTVLVFLTGTVLGALVKSIFEMAIRARLEALAHRAQKQKRKLKKRRKRLRDQARFAVSANPRR